MATRNDEPVITEDYLGYRPMAKHVGELILGCEAPYVISISGAWGSGKTSFMRQLWAYLGGSFEKDGKTQKGTDRQKLCCEWFGETYQDPSVSNKKDGVTHVIWFSPWHHQFEITPLVALLQEIRTHFSIQTKLVNETGKLADVTTYSILSKLDDLAKLISLPLPNAKVIMDRGREYESDHYETLLASQRFREFYEKAIDHIVKGPNGKLIVFIDDLDRCEGDVAFRVLEALKLYLNARKCIYVLGMDQAHLERTIAKVLSGSDETGPHYPRARNYLNKMVQNTFLLPVRKNLTEYITMVLDETDKDFKDQLGIHYDLNIREWPNNVATALDQCLPHNPRKIKSFIAAWKVNVYLIKQQLFSEQKLDWRLSIILTYLGQFEEPLYRKVEESPGFYTDEIVKFCANGTTSHGLFAGIEMPYPRQNITTRNIQSSEEISGGLEPTSIIGSGNTITIAGNSIADKPFAPMRIFWIRELVLEVGVVDRSVIEKHLLGTR